MALGPRLPTIFFKYCSTFDSTADGNIGPVAEALALVLSVDQVILCPAFPEAGRTEFQGHLFVKDQLLSDSPMRDHLLNPMCESDLRQVLSSQSNGTVGHVPMAVVGQGGSAIRKALVNEARDCRNLMVVDAIHDENLLEIGAAGKDFWLVNGGSGAAKGQPANFVKSGLFARTKIERRGQKGQYIILSGSFFEATRR